MLLERSRVDLVLWGLGDINVSALCNTVIISSILDHKKKKGVTRDKEDPPPQDNSSQAEGEQGRGAAL